MRQCSNESLFGQGGASDVPHLCRIVPNVTDPLPVLAEQEEAQVKITDYISRHPAVMTAAAIGVVATGAAIAVGIRKSSDADEGTGKIRTDAPHWVLHKPSQRTMFGRTVLINRPRQEVFDAWRVDRFAEFMDNVVSVEHQGTDVARWHIKAPAGREVTLINRITKTDPGKAIYWQSDPASDIANSGEVRFSDAPAGRGTYVTLILAYSPPAGELGRLAAKLFQREPEIQARRDLNRFKQLLETGEVTTNASPSGRSSESVTEAHI